MLTTARSISSIRDSLLGYWSAEYTLAGKTLQVSVGSEAYLLASRYAVLQNALDAHAVQVARDILPDQASTDALARFGYVYNVPQQTGVAARLTVTVTGALASHLYTIPAGTQMSWTDGTLYDVTDASVTTDGSNHATAHLTCTTIGTSGTRSAGEVLTFQTAPSGLNPTATFLASVTPGAGDEDPAEWAARIIARLRERPASGDRADVAAWVQDYTALDIRAVYVYPLLQPPASFPGAGTVGILGCWTAVALGPPQGDSPTNTRILGAGAGLELTEVKEYINGTRTADGQPTTTGVQLKPVTMSLGDIAVQSASVTSQDVVAALTVTAASAFPFVATPTVDATSSVATVVVGGNYSASGTDLSGKLALVDLGTSVYRGAFYAVALGTGVYDGGTMLTTFPCATLPGPPVAATTLYPAPACFSDLRAATLAYFDALGPGDISPVGRWPTEDTQGRATLYRAALAGDMTDVLGVLSASITTPATNVTPAAKTVLTLGKFRVTP